MHAAAVAKKNALVGKTVAAAKKEAEAASKGNKGGTGKVEVRRRENGGEFRPL